MNLNLFSNTSISYESKSQQIRILTEGWVGNHIFCPRCGNSIMQYENNKPVADFYCQHCIEDYELKSKKDKMGRKIVDGAYSTMIKRLQSASSPNFFFLNYEESTLDIINFLVIPKYFFTPDIIEKRKPLSSTARRAGWVGCNILIDTIPESGKIFYIKNKQSIGKSNIIEKWHKTSFLNDTTDLQSKGWLLEIIKCIEQTNKINFTLMDIYQFEGYLKNKYPDNNNIKAKIRQQLQILRDKKYLEFINRGKYKLKK